MAGPGVITLAALCARMTERQIVDGNLAVCRALSAFRTLGMRKFGMPDVPRPNVPIWFESCFDNYIGTTWRMIPRVNPNTDPRSFELGYFIGFARWFEKWAERLDSIFAKAPDIRFSHLTKAGRREIYKAWKVAILPPEIEQELKIAESVPRRGGNDREDDCNGSLRLLLGNK